MNSGGIRLESHCERRYPVNGFGSNPDVVISPDTRCKLTKPRKERGKYRGAINFCEGSQTEGLAFRPTLRLAFSCYRVIGIPQMLLSLRLSFVQKPQSMDRR